MSKLIAAIHLFIYICSGMFLLASNSEILNAEFLIRFWVMCFLVLAGITVSSTYLIFGDKID